jgi:hypothetical protein
MEQNTHTVRNGKKKKRKVNYLEKMIIGIDPGKSGGIAWIYEDGLVNCKNCPDDTKQMADLIRSLQKNNNKIICYLESVHAFPTDGRSSAFKFGMNFGMWQGILSSFNIEVVLVTPQKWQKHFGDLPKNKKERKNMIKQIASELSGLKATLKTADAICITYYGKANVTQIN